MNDKINLSKEFPLTREGIIKQLKAKIRILTPKKESNIKSQDKSFSQKTPKFYGPLETHDKTNSPAFNKKFYVSFNARLKRNKRNKDKNKSISVFQEKSNINSPKSSARMKSSSLFRTFLYFQNFSIVNKGRKIDSSFQLFKFDESGIFMKEIDEALQENDNDCMIKCKKLFKKEEL